VLQVNSDGSGSVPDAADGGPAKSTSVAARDSFSDVDSDLGELVAELVSDLATAPTGPRFEAGTIVAGHFEVVRKLGQGGMGIVWLARDLRLDREVGLKLVGRRSSQATTRLEREAQAMAQLAHPNVVAVHEVGMHDGAVYIAMEYVHGSTLRVWQAAADRGWREIVGAYLQAARGLAAAHAVGFVHRDFKPDNVLIGRDGRVRVADFGLARTLGSLEVSADRVISGTPPLDPLLTASDAVLGTPAYMAPEQFNSSVPLGPSVDQFAFGVALHEAVAGARPFGDVPNWIAQPTDRVTIPASRGVPPWLRRLILRTTALSPDDRWPDMHTVADELERGLGLARARKRWIVAVIGASTAVAIGVGLGVTSRPEPCVDAAAASAEVWNADRRVALAAAFDADGDAAVRTWTSVQPLIHEWFARWDETRIAGCRATRIDGSQSDLLLDRQVACLDTRLARVTAILEALGRDRGPRQRVEDLAVALPDIASCTDPQYLQSRVALPEDPKVREQVAALTDRFESESIRLELGDVQTMHDRVAALVADADVIGWKPLAARTRWLEGRLALAEGKRTEAIELLRGAYFDARSASDDESASHVAITLGYIDGVVLGDRKASEVWLQHAEADVRRGAVPARAQIAIETTRAQMLQAAADPAAAVQAVERSLLLADSLKVSPQSRLDVESELAAALDAAGRHTEAITQYDRVIESATTLFGPRALRVGMLHNNRGLAHYYLHSFDAAIADLELALRVQVEAGASEAGVAPIRLNLALAIASSGRLDDAASMLERLLAMWRTEANAAIDTALVMKALAWVELRRSRNERALALANEALLLVRSALEPTHPEIATSATLLADAALARGDTATAITQLEAAREIYAAPANAEDPGSVETVVALAEAYLRAGRSEDAQRLVEAALAAADTFESDETTRARAIFVRAQLRAGAGDHSAAREDARAALRMYDDPPYVDRRAEIEAWLKGR
jgi:tetratricopeptide (TPR) repeat protein/predicted Ser/Thr protein kinase